MMCDVCCGVYSVGVDICDQWLMVDGVVDVNRTVERLWVLA